jgi:hypothetical protein
LIPRFGRELISLHAEQAYAPPIPSTYRLQQAGSTFTNAAVRHITHVWHAVHVTVRTYNALRVRFSATVGEEPESSADTIYWDTEHEVLIFGKID